jgi:hypothetical protein
MSNDRNQQGCGPCTQQCMQGRNCPSRSQQAVRSGDGRSVAIVLYTLVKGLLRPRHA